MTTTRVSETQPKEGSTRSEPEEATAAFGFFRRHQKLIIYTAGLFTLLTFSITGAVYSLSARLSQSVELPVLEVPGRTGELKITQEDAEVGRLVRTLKNFQDQGYDVMPVVPHIATKDTSDDPMRFASIRRLALGTGVEASMADAEMAMQNAVRRTGSESMADLARLHGIQDPSRFSGVVHDALRITTYLRLAVLGVGHAYENAAEAILEDNDEIGFLVADLDLDAIKERLEKEPASDAELKKFLEELEEQEQSQYRHPTNKAAYELAFVSTAAFDPASHEDELEGYEPGEAEIRNYYDRHKEDYFKVEPAKKKPEDGGKPGDGGKPEDGGKPGDGGKQKEAAGDQDGQDPATRPSGTDPDAGQEQGPTYRPFDEVKAEIVKKLKLKQVLRAWRKELDARLAEHMQPAFDARYEASEALAKAEKEVEEAKKKVSEKGEKEGKEAAAALKEAEKVLEDREKAYDAAEAGVVKRLRSFDFKAAVESLAEMPVVFAGVEEPKFAEDLKELPADLGTWNGSFAATSVARAGEIHSSVQDAEKGAFLLRVTELQERPFKEFAEIKDDLRVHYYTDKAEEIGEEKKKKFEEALERLAREKGKAAIEEIERKKAEQLKEKVDEWRSGLEQKIQEDSAKLARCEKGGWRYKKLKEKIDGLQAELAGEEEYREGVEEELDKETRDEIKEVEKKHYREVLPAAAKEAGFDLVEVGPYSKNLSQRPRFEQSRTELVQFLFSDPELMEMEEGEATDVLEDKTDRRICLAVCTKVKEAETVAITRRQWKARLEGMSIFAMRQRLIENPALMTSLYQLFQRNPRLQQLQQLFFEAIGGKDKDKARELVHHPELLPVLRQMVAGSAPFSGTQKQLAADQSFTLEALKQGYGWRDPSAIKREATPKVQ